MTEHANMEIDFMDLHGMIDEEAEGVRKAEKADHQQGGVIYVFLRNLLIGSTVLLVLAGLSLFLIDQVREHIISKEDIKYQLSQIDEKMQGVEKETGSSRVLLMRQIEQLTERSDALEGKMDSLNRGGIEALSLEQINRLVTRIDQLDLTIDTLAARIDALTQDRYHLVMRGESLSKIARRYGLEKEALCRLNGISVDHNIHPGDRLLIRQE